MRTPLVRPLLAATLATAALAAPAAPASASCRPTVVLTEHKIYQGPPGPDLFVPVPTVIMGDCGDVIPSGS